ncbi:TPM domain-containing protein [Tabrizicola aquatica]|uniref:TPM domain-containing protein n=1 Tax=Tabrizicola aquatica TaxID=909926 RepID=UPI000CD155EC|nr:TPM domain-containing protein [Tabrizicola aquatica]
MILRTLALWLGLSGIVAAQDLPQPVSDTISDFSEVLDATEEGRITRALQALRDETGVQMVVVTLPTLAAYGGAGQRLETYAKDLFNAWGIGDAQRNDGILLLVVTEAREARIALGSGYDAVYDGRAARVLSTAVLPEFREGRLAVGIEAGIASARERLVVPFQAGQPVGLTDGFAPEVGLGEQVTPWLVGGGGVGGILALILWRSRSRRKCPKCGAQTLERTHEVISPSGMLSSGTGMEHMICSSCGFTDRRTYTIRGTSRSGSRFSSRSSSGGRSGGFGGGRSSGGGASGKW